VTLFLLEGCEDLAAFTNGTVIAGRNGSAIQSSGITYTIPSVYESDTLTIGFAFRITTLSSQVTILGLNSDSGGTQHIRLQLSTDGSLIANRFVTQLGNPSPAGTIIAGRWHYVEVQTKMHDTTGFITVRVNGTTVINVLNTDTKNAGTKTVFDTIAILSAIGSQAADDCYIMSGAGDTFLGDIIVDTLYPNGNGAANQWLGSDGDSINNYLLVNEAGAPNTNTYVGSSTVGQQDLYTIGDVARVGAPIKGVCHAAHVAKSDAVAVRQIKLVGRRAVDTKSSTFVLTTTYQTFSFGSVTDPETGAAWTEANVNALQSGVEVA
jgi:hypothetical protein